MPLMTRSRQLLGALVRRLLALRARLFAPRDRALRQVPGKGLVDPVFYAAQAGTGSMTAQEALEHYLSEGAAAGLLPHPLVDPALAHDPRRSRALADAVSSSRPVASHEVSTAYDWTAYRTSVPAAAKHPGGVVGHYASTERTPGDDVVLVELGSGEPVDWSALNDRTAAAGRSMPTLLASGLFDVDHYQAQLGVTFSSDRAALWHYLTVGEDAGLAANPLVEPEWILGGAPEPGAHVLADYLAGDPRTVSPHPHFDPAAYLDVTPEAASHPGGPLGHYLEHATDGTTTYPVDPAVAPRTWGDLRAALLADASLFAEQQRLRAWGTAKPWDRTAQPAFEAQIAKLAPMVVDAPPTVSVVFDLSLATPRTHQRVAAMLDGDYPALEVVAVATENDPQLEVLDPRVLVAKGSVSATRAARVNAGVRRSTGQFVHVWHPRDTVKPGFYRNSLLGAFAAGTDLVYSAMTTTRSHDALVHGEPFERDGLVWGEFQGFSRTALVARRLFDRLGGHDEELPAFADHDFVLRAAALVDPVFLPQIGIAGSISHKANARAAARAYEHVVRARELCDWDEPAPRVADRVSVLVPVYEDWAMTSLAVQAVLDTTAGRDVEVVLLDNGSRRCVGALLAALHGRRPQVVQVRVPKNTNFATGSNLAFLHSSGERVVFMNNDTIATPGWLEPLLRELDDPTIRAAQPLLLFQDRTVQAAGTVFHRNAFPWHFLQGHPLEDVLRARQTRFSAITAATMACRADELRRLHGFDPVFVNGMEDVDLCLRLAQELGGEFGVALDSVVVHAESQSTGRFDAVGRNRDVFMDRWMRRLPGSDLARYEAAGLLAAHYRPTPRDLRGRMRTGSVVVTRPARVVAEGPARGLPALRWAIKSAALPGPVGDLWGDTFFSEDLAAALRRLGQEVVIDRRDSHQRAASEHLDDVVLALRGLTRIDAQPGATSILWIISHPEVVTDVELNRGFDLVYAASTPWAELATERSGREVRPLLQATDPSRFHPGEQVPELAAHALFVGRTRKIFRPVVRDAIAAGADLTIYGDGWGEFIDTSYVRAEHLDNRDLPAAYRSARIVLNDHWSDMAELGFLSNRLFDAAASGALVVTDPVNGLDDVFGDLVRPYADVDELRTMLAPDGDPWVDDERRLAQARSVGERHSFDARARTLLADVLDERGVPHGLRDVRPALSADDV